METKFPITYKMSSTLKILVHLEKFYFYQLNKLAPTCLFIVINDVDEEGKNNKCYNDCECYVKNKASLLSVPRSRVFPLQSFPKYASHTDLCRLMFSEKQIHVLITI